MTANLEELENRLEKIEERNQRVESDKAWEASYIRRGLVALFTFLAIGIYLSAIHIADPWLNAVVPTVGFTLSTLTLPFFKKVWIKQIYKK